MIIFIRGLPGTGKTSIANTLGEKLNYKIVHVDDFKKEKMNEDPTAFFIEEVIPYSYDKTIEYIENNKDTNLIIEEIFRNRDFVGRVLEICSKYAISYKWFNIIRYKNEILSVNFNRIRKVKNTPESLALIEEQINSIHIDGEILILNKNIQESANQIEKNIV